MKIPGLGLGAQALPLLRAGADKAALGAINRPLRMMRTAEHRVTKYFVNLHYWARENSEQRRQKQTLLPTGVVEKNVCCPWIRFSMVIASSFNRCEIRLSHLLSGRAKL